MRFLFHLIAKQVRFLHPGLMKKIYESFIVLLVVFGFSFGGLWNVAFALNIATSSMTSMLSAGLQPMTDAGHERYTVVFRADQTADAKEWGARFVNGGSDAAVTVQFFGPWLSSSSASSSLQVATTSSSLLPYLLDSVAFTVPAGKASSSFVRASTTFSAVSGEWYAWQVNTTSTPAGLSLVGDTSTGPTAAGTMYRTFYDTDPGTGCDGLRGADPQYFKMGGQTLGGCRVGGASHYWGFHWYLDGGVPPQNTVDLNITASSSIADFEKWSLDLSSVDTSGEVCVNYNPLSSSTYAYKDCSPWQIPNVSENFPVYKTHALWFPPLSSHVRWFAYATLENSSGVNVATSSVKDFVIDSGLAITTSSVSLVPGSIASSTTFALADCSAYEIALFSSSTLQGISCVTENTLRTALNYIVELPSAFAARMSSVYFLATQAAQGVFPINVFVAVNSALDSVQATSTPTVVSFTGTGTAFKRSAGVYYQYTFLTSSTASWLEARGWAYKDWFDKILYLFALCVIVFVGVLAVHVFHDSRASGKK